MRQALGLILAAVLLAGCTDQSDRIAFDGMYFRTKVTQVDGQRDVFQVTVRDAAKSIEGARAAGLYEANVYCVGTYGSSEIDWTLAPDAPADQLRMVDGALLFQGTCPQ